ncbi:MAG: hypothetical protein JXM73_18415 [Anaerolineae bacterium]|nr:hypothetical protein [Anaerolineae bacterium]
MPPLARLYVRTAFVYFVAGFLLLALIALDGWLNIGRWFGAVYLSQLHLLVVGWITQLSIGVAYWMFPRFLKEVNPRPRGSEALAWAVYVCLNAGLVLRLAAEPFYRMKGESWLAALVALSGVLQAAAAVGFGLLIWARIRPLE